MRIGQTVTLATEQHRINWRVVGIDVYGRITCYTLEGRMGDGWDGYTREMRLTDREMRMNGART